MYFLLALDRLGWFFRFSGVLAFAVFIGACDGLSSEQLLDQAKKSHAAGDNAAAMIQLKNALQRNPKEGGARYLLGVIYNENLQGTAAENELRRARELGLIEGGRVAAQLGRALLLQEEYKKVLEEIKPAPAFEDVAVASILAARGSAHFALNQIAEAKQSFDQALGARAEYADALLGQALLAGRERDLDEAARLIERAIASEPKNLEPWLLKGDLRWALADQAGAAAAYQKVLELKLDHPTARLNIATLEIARGNFDAAHKHIEQMRKFAPASPVANYLQALMDFRKKNYPAAHEAILQTLKATPNHVQSVLLAGAIEFALGMHEQAQANLERVVDRIPASLYARKLFAASLAKSGQVPRAIEVLQPGLRQAPQDGPLAALAGEIYMQSNDFAKAAQYFDKASKLDPKSASARTGLGVSRLALGETERALADLESAVQLDSDSYHADVTLVVSHLQRGNYDQALTALGSLEKKQPNNPLTYNLKAAIYVGKGDIAAARKSLERAVEAQPTYIAAAMNLARLDLQDKKPQVARRRFEAVLEKDKTNLEALLALADFGPSIGATQKEQIDWLERARKASPRSVQPQLMLARLYARGGDAKKALEVALQAQATGPDNPEVLNTLGAIQLAVGDKNQALNTYSRLAALQPNSPDALYRLASAQAANASQAAATTLKRALALKPDFLDAQVALIEAEARAGRFPEALNIAQQVQKEAATSPLGFALEGDVLMMQKKFPQAAKAYEGAYRIRKTGALAVKLHAAYAQAGKPQEGEARLTQWLKESPDDAAVRLYVADAHLKSGKYQNASEQYEWLLRKQPDNALVLNNLALTYRELKDPRALETAERAYQLKPDNAAVADTLGWLLVEQGNPKRGLQLLQKAVAAAPEAIHIRYHLAQAQAKSGDKAEAIRNLQQVVAARPKFAQEPEARALLDQLNK